VIDEGAFSGELRGDSREFRHARAVRCSRVVILDSGATIVTSKAAVNAFGGRSRVRGSFMIQLERPSVPESVERILDRHGNRPQAVLQALIDVQHAWHHVPGAVVLALAERLGVPAVRLRGLIGFYSFLSADFQGDFVVHLSDNITDQMAGSRELSARLCGRLGVALGKTRADGRVSVNRTSCTGMSDQGPSALINYRPVPRLDAKRVDLITDLINARTPLDEWPSDFFVVESRIRRSDVIFRNALDSGAGLRASLDRGGKNLEAWEEDLAPTDARKHQLDRGGAETLKEIYRSELRGRGGAGFKAGIKWQTVREAAKGDRFVICNAGDLQGPYPADRARGHGVRGHDDLRPRRRSASRHHVRAAGVLLSPRPSAKRPAPPP